MVNALTDDNDSMCEKCDSKHEKRLMQLRAAVARFSAVRRAVDRIRVNTDSSRRQTADRMTFTLTSLNRRLHDQQTVVNAYKQRLVTEIHDDHETLDYQVEDQPVEVTIAGIRALLDDIASRAIQLADGYGDIGEAVAETNRHIEHQLS